MIPPILLLSLALGVTLAAFVADAVARRSRARKLSALATAWQSRFTPDDRFQLAPRVAARFPTPGAADVVVRDLIYGREAGGRLRYLFTVEYTVGVLRTKRRRVAVAMVVEGATPAAVPFSDVTLAPAQLPLVGQYEWLRGQRAWEQ